MLCSPLPIHVRTTLLSVPSLLWGHGAADGQAVKTGRIWSDSVNNGLKLSRHRSVTTFLSWPIIFEGPLPPNVYLTAHSLTELVVRPHLVESYPKILLVVNIWSWELNRMESSPRMQSCFHSAMKRFCVNQGLIKFWLRLVNGERWVLTERSLMGCC